MGKTEHPWARAGFHLRSRADRSGQYLLRIPLPRPPKRARLKHPPPQWDEVAVECLRYIERVISASGGRLKDEPGLLRVLAYSARCPQGMILTFLAYGRLTIYEGYWLSGARPY